MCYSLKYSILLICCSIIIHEATGFFFFNNFYHERPTTTQSTEGNSSAMPIATTTHSSVCLSIPMAFRGKWFTTLDNGNVLEVSGRTIREKSTRQPKAQVYTISQLVCHNDKVVFKNVAIGYIPTVHRQGQLPLKNKCWMIYKNTNKKNVMILKMSLKQETFCNMKTFEHPNEYQEYVMSRDHIPAIIVTSIKCDHINKTNAYLRQPHLHIQATNKRNCALMCSINKFAASFMLNSSECYCISNNAVLYKGQHPCYGLNINDKMMIYKTQTRNSFQQNTNRRLRQASQLIQHVAASLFAPMFRSHNHMGNIRNNSTSGRQTTDGIVNSTQSNVTQINTRNDSTSVNATQSDSTQINTTHNGSNQMNTSEKDTHQFGMKTNNNGRMIMFMIPLRAAQMIDTNSTGAAA